MKLIYKKLNWKTVRKSISVMLLLGLFSLGAVGDSWNGISVKANGTPIKVMPLGDSITTGKYSGANTSSPGGDFDELNLQWIEYSRYQSILAVDRYRRNLDHCSCCGRIEPPEKLIGNSTL